MIYFKRTLLYALPYGLLLLIASFSSPASAGVDSVNYWLGNQAGVFGDTKGCVSVNGNAPGTQAISKFNSGFSSVVGPACAAWKLPSSLSGYNYHGASSSNGFEYALSCGAVSNGTPPYPPSAAGTEVYTSVHWCYYERVFCDTSETKKFGMSTVLKNLTFDGCRFEFASSPADSALVSCEGSLASSEGVMTHLELQDFESSSLSDECEFFGQFTYKNTGINEAGADTPDIELDKRASLDAPVTAEVQTWQQKLFPPVNNSGTFTDNIGQTWDYHESTTKSETKGSSAVQKVQTHSNGVTAEATGREAVQETTRDRTYYGKSESNAGEVKSHSGMSVRHSSGGAYTVDLGSGVQTTSSLNANQNTKSTTNIISETVIKYVEAGSPVEGAPPLFSQAELNAAIVKEVDSLKALYADEFAALRAAIAAGPNRNGPPVALAPPCADCGPAPPPADPDDEYDEYCDDPAHSESLRCRNADTPPDGDGSGGITQAEVEAAVSSAIDGTLPAILSGALADTFGSGVDATDSTDLYTPVAERTVSTIFAGFTSELQATPLYSSISSFFTVSASAACPVYTGSFTQPFAFTITFDHFCKEPMTTFFPFIAAILLFGATYLSFRIAFL